MKKTKLHRFAAVVLTAMLCVGVSAEAVPVFAQEITVLAATVQQEEEPDIISDDGTWTTINGSKYYYFADVTKATMWQTIDGKNVTSVRPV